jgi:AcrR family transcriptional regulator
MEPRRKAAETRRDELVAAARIELASQSYEHVGLRQVAARAGMDTAKLVRAFGSKERLLVELLNDTFDSLPPELPAGWTDDLAAELTGAAASRLTEPFRIIAFSASSPEVDTLVLARVPDLLRWLDGAVRPGGAPGVRAAVAAAVVFGVILSRDVIGLEPPGGGRICAPLVARLLRSLEQPAEGDGRLAGPRRFGVAEAKSAILKAADAAFSQRGYEHATVRRIAAEADVDPALVVRYFGSKEALFREVLLQHFPGPGTPDRFSTTAAAALAAPTPAGSLLDITLRSAPSPAAREILKADIEARFLAAYRDELGGEKMPLRALLHSALFMGGAFCNSILRVPAIQAHRAEAVQQLAGLFRLASGAA